MVLAFMLSDRQLQYIAIHGDFPHDSWGTVLPRVLLIGSCGFLHFRNLLTHKLNVCA